jgi:hypothetical protein
MRGDCIPGVGIASPGFKGYGNTIFRQEVQKDCICAFPGVIIYKKGENMKPKKEKKLSLRKETIQDLDNILDKDEQQRVKGGSDTDTKGTTQVPIYC